jgi:hypothetical protein
MFDEDDFRLMGGLLGRPSVSGEWEEECRLFESAQMLLDTYDKIS